MWLYSWKKCLVRAYILLLKISLNCLYYCCYCCYSYRKKAWWLAWRKLWNFIMLQMTLNRLLHLNEQSQRFSWYLVRQQVVKNHAYPKYSVSILRQNINQTFQKWLSYQLSKDCTQKNFWSAMRSKFGYFTQVFKNVGSYVIWTTWKAQGVGDTC